MKVRLSPPSSLAETDLEADGLSSCCSCAVRERTEYYSRTTDARACEPPVHMQPAVQLPGYRVHVSTIARYGCFPARPRLTGRIHRYLVVDLMSGGDLRFHISRKTFTEEAVRFWIAELGCALQYIHGQGIIHRDVKPDKCVPFAVEMSSSSLLLLTRSQRPLGCRRPRPPNRLCEASRPMIG